MSTIRRQSIISSGVIYFGFALGFVNIFLFTRRFSPEQYGLTNMFIVLANIMYSFASLGMPNYIYKFYPYYKDNLEPKKNDLVSWALLVGLAGFLLVVIGGIMFKDIVIRKFQAQSPELITYYYWIFPFGLGLTLYSLLEAYGWHLKISVLTNYLKEVQFRLFFTVLILLWYIGILTRFDVFIKIYALTYLMITMILLGYLISTGRINITFDPSRVTKKFFKKIVLQASLVWGGGFLYNLSLYFAQVVIAALIPNGLSYVGIYSLAQNIASLVQAPQRGVIAAAIGPISRAWKDKDYEKLDRVYKRSSINQLIFAIAIFLLIWLNFTDGVLTFDLKKEYLASRDIFLLIGLTRIIDMGTGLNGQLIATSTFWRFDFFTGVTLAAITLPLNYLLTRQLGYIGPAIADLITFTIYNGMRWAFLYRKFGMQPFTFKTLSTVLLGLVSYFICHWLLSGVHGFIGLFSRSILFILLFGAGVLALRLSDDILPVWNTIKKRLGLAPRS